MAGDGLAAPRPQQPSGARTERCALPGEAASVPEARRFVRRVLAGWGRDEYEEAGAMLVSELASNAVLHARTDVVVELVDGEQGVVLGVGDDSSAMPVLRRHTREAGTGRGLWLLDQYSLAHGVDVRTPGPGKQVWAVLRPESHDEVEDADAALALWLDKVEGL